MDFLSQLSAPTVARDPVADGLAEFLKLAESRVVKAPFAYYANDPVGFFEEVLGIVPWGRYDALPIERGSQVDIINAVRDSDRVAVRSGHKVAKSNSASGLALWWLLTQTDSRVTLTAPANHQVESILWSEVRLLYTGKHPGLKPGHVHRQLPGKLHKDCRSGLELGDGWCILGLTTNEPERMSGKSGAKQLYIVDEASGYPEEIYTSIFGNMAGGGKVVLFGNPTRPSGTFYDIFHGKGAGWKKLHISSLDTPNFHGGDIPGLANPEWNEWAVEHWGGPGMPLYDVRVLGEFPQQGENSVVALSLVDAGRERWATTPDDGELDLGVDVAREGDDESIIASRRGKKILKLEPVRIDPSSSVPPGHQVGEAVAQSAFKQAMVLKDKSGAAIGKERVRVKVDEIGVGSSVLDYLISKYAGKLDIIGVNVSRAADKECIVAPRVGNQPAKTAYDTYRNLRSQIGFGVATWLRQGGAIPPDDKLHTELVAPTFFFAERGRLAIEEKKEVKKRIKRSPDRADAVALAIYDPVRVAVPRGVGTKPLGFFY